MSRFCGKSIDDYQNWPQWIKLTLSLWLGRENVFEALPDNIEFLMASQNQLDSRYGWVREV